MARSRIFISYRRDDAAGYSHAIHDRLADHLGGDQLFMDVHDIAPGADFARRLRDVVQGCEVVVALIGKRWVGEREGQPARIHDERDWVRIEVAEALRRGIRVIPVLLDGARLPAAEDLPDDLQGLRLLNSMEVRTTRLDADVRDLVGATVQAVGGTWPPVEPGARLHAAVGGLYTLFAGGALVLGLLASAFVDEVSDHTFTGLLGLMLAAAVALRLPLHNKLRALSREQALKWAAGLHLGAFVMLAAGSNGETDAAAVIFLGLLPAGLLYRSSMGMRRTARV
jgi:hypothetical protein